MPRPRYSRSLVATVFTLGCLLLGFCLVACAPKEGEQTASTDAPARPLVKLRLQTDWFPQAEHGGFYQALAKGYYLEEGLDVTLLPGGPGAHIKPKVLGGDAEFGMNPASDLIVAASRGMHFTLLAPYLQHDHQALLLHDDDPVRDFPDLEGRTVMAAPSLAWIQYLQRKYKIRFNVQPVPFGLATFAVDPRAIRQCIITNEPYLAAQLKLPIRTLRLADAGYDGYQVIFSRREYAQANPELVAAFVRASLRGWRDYAAGDPTPAHSLILQRNAEMTSDFLNYSRTQMLNHALIGSLKSDSPEAIGRFRIERLQAQCRLMFELGMSDREIKPEDITDLRQVR